MARIVIVEDEPALREDIALYLRTEGHDVEQAGDGAAFDRLPGPPPEIVVLDVSLPGETGFEIAARLRGGFDPGIIMLTARGLEDDRLTGLDAGADIYLAKPVSLRELAAHVRTLARRLSSDPMASAEEAPTWRVRRIGWRLVAPTGEEIPLSKLEMRFLASLGAEPHVPVSRDNLAQAIYGTNLDSDSRALDAMVRRLKVKVEKAVGVPLPVQALYAAGYVFSAPLRFAD